MTDECISPLRRRMIEDMTVRNFVPKTQSDYIRRVKNFAVFLGRTPDRASREDVRGYLLHLASSGVGGGNLPGQRHRIGAAVFLFDVTLDRAGYRFLEAFRVRHGDKRIALMERKHVLAIIAEKADKPAAQRNLLRVLRVLLGFAVEQGLRSDNPALGIKLKAMIETSGYHSWTEDELRQYEQRHPIGTKARLALALLLYTAQRRADVVRLGPSNAQNGRLYLTQSKTRTEMDIPVAPPLAEIIAATPMVGVKTFLVTEYGRPFTPAGFGNWFRDRCNEAALPNARRTGCARRFCGAWPRLVARRTSSPASAATKICARSEPTWKRPTRRAWRPRAWRGRLRGSLRLESERHDCETKG